MKKWLTIGSAVGSHGIRGELKITPLTDDVTRFEALETVWVNQKNVRTAYEVTGVRFHKGQVLLALSGITDRNASDKLKGARLEVPREEAVPLAENEIYIADLIGLKALDPEGREIGKIADVLTTTGPVKTVDIKLAQQKKHIYVPFRRVFFSAWDLDAGTITADIPRDYFEL